MNDVNVLYICQSSIVDTTFTYIHVSRKLQVSTYYILHELGVTFDIRVTGYYLLHELRVNFYMQVTSK